MTDDHRDLQRDPHAASGWENSSTCTSRSRSCAGTLAGRPSATQPQVPSPPLPVPHSAWPTLPPRCHRLCCQRATQAEVGPSCWGGMLRSVSWRRWTVETRRSPLTRQPTWLLSLRQVRGGSVCGGGRFGSIGRFGCVGGGLALAVVVAVDLGLVVTCVAACCCRRCCCSRC